MAGKYRSCFIDFEFNRIVEPKVNLVCAAIYDEKNDLKETFWLHKSKSAKRDFKKFISEYNTLLCYSAVAECRSFVALGFDPRDFNWVDLFIEYRLMTNHNDRLIYGKQLVDGRVRSFRKPLPKWERSVHDKEKGFRPTHSLAEATFKLTGQKRDTKEKTRMRDLIISDPEEFSSKDRKDILAYCLDDVVDLPNIWTALKKEYKKLEDPRGSNPETMNDYFHDALVRGRYSAHTAMMETRGYPIDVEKTENFSKQIDTILFDVQREINTLHPDVKPFRWNKKENRFSVNQNNIKQWIEDNHNVEKWQKTDGDDISLALEAFQRFYDFKHSYPEDNFGAQIVRFLKMKQSLYGFSKTGKTKGFWDYVGSDGRVRPYMNHFGAQSGRSQPGANGFMFLKPAWMRSLVTPKRGHFMACIDYGQQEFFLSGLVSGDKNMINAYLSGDPYLYGAKLAGAIPKKGTREKYELVRDVFKNTYLGILFNMTKFGLAFKLTNDTKKNWSEDEAQDQIDIFEGTFPYYCDWRKIVVEEYNSGFRIRLPCGWRMWCDNENFRSVANVPIQGFGASIMRKAVDIAERNGVEVLFTLHDAIYIEGLIGQEKKILILRDAMREAFIYYFENKRHRELAANIKLDPFAWSPNYKKDSTLKLKSWDVPVSNLYVDKRGKEDYEKFSKYFEASDLDLV